MTSTKNLLEETLDAIRQMDKTLDEVDWVGTTDGAYRITWDEFTLIANVDYDPGYGAAEVATDLVVAFADGRTMWRGEYDGSEWWEWEAPIVPAPDAPKKFEAVVGRLWPTVAELNEPGENFHKRGQANE